MNSDDSIERMEDEASLWAARLRSGSMTDADGRDLEAWFAADPAHRAVLARYGDLTTAIDAHYGAEEQAMTRRGWWRVAGAATVLAAAAALVIAIFITRPETFTTRTAERRVVALEDGSRIELNARTELSVDFGRRERRVRLAEGEALFIVAKDAARPFVVATPGGVVRVTGTVFDVRARESSRLEVTVLEGHVAVRPLARVASDSALVANRRAVVSDQQVTVQTLSAAAARDVVAWRDGYVVFEDAPLGQALSHFAAYDSRTIEVVGAASDLRIGGRYSLNDLDGALELIEHALPIRVVREPGVVRVIPVRP